MRNGATGSRPAEEGEVQVDGRRVGWARFGRPGGFPVVYCHGWPGSRLEGGLAAAGAETAAVDLVALDRPGLGKSTPQAGRTLSGWAGDVVAVADRLGWGRFAVLGVSGGAGFGLACALAEPGRVVTLGLVSPLGPPDSPGVPLLSRAQRGILAGARRAPALIRPALWYMRRRARAGTLMAAMTGTMPPADREVMAAGGVAALLEASVAESLRGGTAGSAIDLSLVARPWGLAYADLRCPALLWHGDDDRNAPLAMGEHLAGVLPGSRMTVFPGDGHYLIAPRAATILDELRSAASG